MSRLGGYSSHSASPLDRLTDAFYSISSSLPCLSHPASDSASCFTPIQNLISSITGSIGLASTSASGGQATTLKLNGRNIDVLKLLGEGGFSFVYLARDRESGRLFALKKIRCSHGSSAFKDALKEIQATQRFRSPHIIRVLDSAILNDSNSSTTIGSLPTSDPDARGNSSGDVQDKVVYLFLPYYKKGNLQDEINRHVINSTRFPEREMLEAFIGACEGVKKMHGYRLPLVGLTTPGDGNQRQRQPRESTQMSTSSTINGMDGEEGLEDDAPLISKEDRDEDDQLSGGGAAYPPRPSGDAEVKGKGKNRQVDELVREQELEGEEESLGKGGDPMPYAHRDIKPANIMLTDSNLSILMDFGSTIPARVTISSRKEAIAHQDFAAERSSMPYRAPELFDIKTNSTLDESVDIWSLGCTLYAMAYLHSPFETEDIMNQGGSLAMAVMNGKFTFPKNDHYGEKTREVIRECLKLKAGERPDIEKVLELSREALRSVS